MSLTKQKQLQEFYAPSVSDNGKTFIYNSTTGENEYKNIVSSDANNLLTTGTDFGAYINAEAVQDAIGLAIVNGTGITYDDALNAITATANNITEEFVLDTIGDNFVDTATIDFTYNDATDSITADVKLDTANGGITSTSNGLLFNADGANTYSNTVSGLTASTVQDAIDELADKMPLEDYDAFNSVTSAASTNFSVTLSNSILTNTVPDVYINGENVNEYVVSASGTTVTINVPYAVDTTDTVKVLYK